jgi:protein involved in polysaccharide export with SLBB domain
MRTPERPSAPQAAPARQPAQAPTAKEELSEFEKYVSGRPVEITDFQLETIKRFEGLSFQYTSKNLPPDKTAVAVQVIKIASRVEKEKAEQPGAAQTVPQTPAAETIKEYEISEVPIIVDAGYIVGPADLLATVFRMLGIKSHLTTQIDMRQFGYDLFALPPSTFAPVEQVPVGPDYVIGPGDEIRIDIWGSVEGQWSAVVDRDGSLSLPRLGRIGVAGLSFRELKDLLHAEFSKYYKGFEMSVAMGALRTVRVYVVGAAQRPGAYTVSSLATLVNALFEAGGPAKTGSMRDIQLKRNGQTVVQFDLYEFLLAGDKSKDARLMPEDVIFIPPVGPLSAVMGSVHNPAIYELKGESKISELIGLAGGLNPIAFKGRVRIERVVENARQVVFESSIEEIGEKDLPLSSGDVVQIFPVSRDWRTVRVSGAVQKAGEYGLKAGMTVADLISMSGGLRYYAFKEEAELTRVHVTDAGPRMEKFSVNLEKALAGDPAGNPELKEDDYLFVRTVPEWGLYRTVTVSGEVRFPGTYTVRKGERLSSLIERAGGYTDNAYPRGAVFTRQSVRELQQKGIDEMARRIEAELFAEGSAQASVSRPEDVAAQRLEMEQKRKFIATLKAVKASGRMTVVLDSPEALKRGPFDIEFEEGDTLQVAARSSVVNVLGAVMAQGSFIYNEPLGTGDYIKLTGGYTRYADKSNSYILKVDGSARKLSGETIIWNPASGRWERGGRDVEPGDTIVVPERLDRIAWLKEIKDITQILMQMAITAGVVIRLFDPND